MAEKIHYAGIQRAKKLINSGLVDIESDWSFSAADGNKLLGPNGDNWDNYGRFHLVEDTEFDEDTKQHWKYPFGKDGMVFWSGVVAVKQRAAQQGFDDLVEVADSLMEMMKPEEDEDGDACGTKKKKKFAADSEGQERIDFMPWPEDGPDGDYMTSKMVLTEDGFLKGRAIVTNVGVFPYRLADGSIQYELRPPEEVFAEDSVRSLQGVPMTNDHPPVKVNAENSKELSVGFTGEDVHQDQYHLAPSLTVTDGDAVKDVHNGKKALSCGYSVDLEMTSGVWMGIHYDAIQRNIRYNHVAIVPKGRAGDAAAMKLDSVDSVGVQKIDYEGASSMKKITIDGMTFEVQDDNLAAIVQKKLDELEQVKADAKELETAKADKATAEATADQLKEDNDNLKNQIAELEKTDHSEAIAAGVKARLDLEKAAEKAGVEIKADMSDEDVKKAVVLKVYPGAKEKLDAGDAVYVQARFDGAVETLETNPPKQNTLRGDSLGDGISDPNPDNQDDGGTKLDAEASRQKMIGEMKNRSRRKEG